MAPLEICLLTLLPLAALKGAQSNKVLNTLGPVVLCYLIGILLRNLVPGDHFNQSSSLLSEVAVPLSIPLLLFGQNLLAELRQTGKMLFAFLLASLSVGLMASLMGWVFHASLPESWKLAGMLVGVYTGGTPNMASIGLALQVQESSFLLLTAADTLLGGAYLLLLLSVLKPLLQPFFPKVHNEQTESEATPEASALNWPDGTKALLLSALIVGVSAGVSLLLLKRLSIPVVMLLLTALGLLASLWEPARQLKSAFQLGEYLILVFCVAIGSQLQLATVMAQFHSPVLLFCAAVMLGSIVLHLILARLCRLDLDSTLIASTAAVYGPPFVGAVAESIQRRDLIGAGLSVGVLGYALGNYLGLAVAYGLSALLH